MWGTSKQYCGEVVIVMWTVKYMRGGTVNDKDTLSTCCTCTKAKINCRQLNIWITGSFHRACATTVLLTSTSHFVQIKIEDNLGVEGGYYFILLEGNLTIIRGILALSRSVRHGITEIKYMLFIFSQPRLMWNSKATVKYGHIMSGCRLIQV
jgi:hypothetical protein